jgi:protein ImuB
MTLAHARSLIGGEVNVYPHDPERDRQTLRALGRWAMRFTPVVALDPPDGLLLDITGCDRVFGGEGRLLRAVMDGLRRLGITGRCAITPTIGASWALARFAPRSGQIIDELPPDEALAPLPLAALRLEPATVTGLQRLGFERIDQLWAMPRASLVERFGQDLLLRLDQARGQAFEPIQPIQPPARIEARQSFDGAVQQLEAIQQSVQHLIEQLCQKLTHQERGVSQLQLEATRLDASNWHHTWSLTQPSRDGRHLWRLMQPGVEKMHLGYGVEQLTLLALRTATLAHTQQNAWAQSATVQSSAFDQSLAALVDQLSEALGRDRVVTAQPVETYVPERAFRYRPLHEGSAPASAARLVAADRPTHLFKRPQRAEVMLMSPDGPLMRMRYQGQTFGLVTSVGPERISPRWWLAPPGLAPRPRDYFKVQDEAGQWWWVYRKAGTHQWFVHGVWC